MKKNNAKKKNNVVGKPIHFFIITYLCRTFFK